MTTKCYLAALFVLASGIAVAEAAEADQAMFKFGGFGSLGVSHSSEKLGDYVLDNTVPKGPGRSNSWSWGNDSRIGAQVQANFTPKVSAVLQVVSEYQSDSTYRPAVEWANVKYAFTPNAYIRVGRIALPTFMHSDNRKVGYSYPWIHPPIDLYRQLAITNSDGVDAMYRFDMGEAENTIKALVGRNKLDRPTATSTSKEMWGIFDTLEYGAATFHVGYQMREASSLTLATGAVGPWIQNSDLSLGASYDPGTWFAISEWIQRRSSSKIDAMYVSAGYRLDKFKLTPYLSYSQDSPPSTLPGFTPSTTQRSQSTSSLGGRWNFMHNTNFKLQYDQVKLSDHSNGYLANVPTGVKLYGTRFEVLSAVVDFVF